MCKNRTVERPECTLLKGVYSGREVLSDTYLLTVTSVASYYIYIYIYLTPSQLNVVVLWSSL